jgi:hypothetical protein
MIDRDHDLPLQRQARLLRLRRSSVYYLPRPVSASDHAGLAERAGQKIILQCQLANLGVQLLQIDRRRCCTLRNTAKNTGSAFQQLPAPRRDLVRMDIKLLRQLGQRLVPFDGGQSHLRLEGRCVIPSRTLRHLLS